jgi:nucleotide-binding universal stress UspA family protein
MSLHSTWVSTAHDNLAPSVMKFERILLPLDIKKCPLEVFSVVNDLVRDRGAIVTLLYVVTLNIAASETRVYEELGRDAHWYLERLTRGWLRPDIATIIHVRFGNVAEEILAEAAGCNTDLIILPSHPPSCWSRLCALILPRVTERLVRRATCYVFRASAQDRFDCEDVWGRSDARTDRVLGCLDTEDALALNRKLDRAVA